jgi:hypothetical protein
MNSIWDFWRALVNQLPHGFAADVFKTLIGTFIGAGLAFWFALRKDRLTRLHEQRAAGNAAVTTLGRMISDYMQVRYAIHDHRRRVLAEQPQTPLWMQVKPVPFWRADLHFDVEALTFIFDHADGPDVYNKLMNVEIKYHAFFHILEAHQEVAEEAQDVLAAAHPDPTQPRRLREINDALGFARVARMDSLAQGIFSHVDDTRPLLEDAAKALPKLLKTIFKKGVVAMALPTEEALKRTLVN